METRRTRRSAAVPKTETPPPTAQLPTRELSSRRKKLPRYLEEDYVPDNLTERPTKSSRKLTPPVETVQEPTTSTNVPIPKVAIKVEADETFKGLSPETSPSTTLTADSCRICLKSHTKDSGSGMVSCTARPCEYKVHLQCLKDSYPFEFLDSFIPYFKCPAHRICVVCGRKKNAQEEVCVTCVECNRMFHIKCHSPPVASPFSNWTCSACDPVDVPAAPSAPSKKVLQEDEKVLKKIRAEKKKLRLLKAAEKAKAKEMKEAARRAAIERTLLRTSEKNSAKTDKKAERELKRLKREEKRKRKMLMKANSRTHSGSEREDSMLSGETSLSEEEEVEINPVFVRHLEAKRMLMQEESELRHDLCLWTVDQCASYFVDSFPDLADLIRKHDLYGSSLMLVSSDQFRKLFGLPLGKYLIFYDAICKWRKVKF